MKQIINDSMLNLDKHIEPNSIDSIVTDPPYELNFMGKGWDNTGIAFQKETWEKCFNALKPGGYLLAFGGSRTFHRIAVSIEDAGFEIRDCIMWLYGSGFPKSMNIGLAIDKKNGVDNRTGNIKTDGKATNSGSGCYNCNNGLDNSMKKEYEERIAQNEWNGWGTCLKPAFEPIIVARKPFKGSLVDNIIANGVGGLNIDECRVSFNGDKWQKQKSGKSSRAFQSEETTTAGGLCEPNDLGRFPANVILTYDENDFDEVCGGFPDTKGGNRKNTAVRKSDKTSYGFELNTRNEFNDSGSASRYFYCAKASKKDRDEGLEEFEEKKTGILQGGRKEGSAGSIMKNADGGTRVNPYAGIGTPKKNIHPTVKPTQLMQYLVRLVTPKGGTILDPFMGSGSTGKATMYENKERNSNYKFIGFELNKEYCDIAEARINYASKDIIKHENKKDKKNQKYNIMSIFDYID